MRASSKTVKARVHMERNRNALKKVKEKRKAKNTGKVKQQQ